MVHKPTLVFNPTEEVQEFPGQLQSWSRDHTGPASSSGTMPACPKRQNVWMGLSSKVKAIGSRRLTDRSSYFMTQSQI